MESDGAMALFQRSENNRNLIYGTCIGYGDSKAYSSVKTAGLMGLSVTLIKKSVGHILQGEWAPDYGRFLKITKVCFVGQISSHTPAFLSFQIN